MATKTVDPRIADTTTITEDGETEDFALDQPYVIPSDESFHGEDFKDATDLESIASDLRQEYEGDFQHIGSDAITFLWKKKSGMRGGKIIRYDTIRTPVLARFYSGHDFTVWVASDALRNTGVTEQTIRAIIFHSLLHIGYNENREECVIRDHEFSGFLAELDAFGPWENELKRAGRKFKSINGNFDEPMPEAEATDEQVSLLEADEAEGEVE